MSDDLISRKALLEVIDISFIIPILKMNLRPEHEAVLKIREIIMDMPTAFDRKDLIKELKELKTMCFLTIASTGCEKLDCAYKRGVDNALAGAIEIVESGMDK